MDELLERERHLRIQKNDEEMLLLMQKIMSICKNDTEKLLYLKILSKRKGQLQKPLKKTIQSVFEEKLDFVLQYLPQNKNKFVLFNSSVSENNQDLLFDPEYTFFEENIASNTTNENNSHEFIDQFVDFSTTLLKDIVEGKFCLEEERVHISSQLKHVFERIERYFEAMEIVFNVPVETFSSISEAQKVKYQLEVLRLCYVNRDWAKCDLITKRMRRSYFKSEEARKDEINYLILKTGVSLGQKRFIEAAQNLQKLVEIDEKDRTLRTVLCSFYAILADHSAERTAILRHCEESAHNVNSARFHVKRFLGTEIMLREFTSDFSSAVYIISHEKDFLMAIDNHNLRVVALFFESIRIDDLSGLLQCNFDECIERVCTAVNARKLFCKIDQNKNIISFSNEVTDSENEKIADVLNKISHIGTLIDKETTEM